MFEFIYGFMCTFIGVLIGTVVGYKLEQRSWVKDARKWGQHGCENVLYIVLEEIRLNQVYVRRDFNEKTCRVTMDGLEKGIDEALEECKDHGAGYAVGHLHRIKNQIILTRDIVEVFGPETEDAKVAED